MTIRPAHNLASLFCDDDVYRATIESRSVSVGYHDAAHRRTAADFVALGVWSLDFTSAVVTQSGVVNDVIVELYSKADGVDWKRYHDAQGGAA